MYRIFKLLFTLIVISALSISCSKTDAEHKQPEQKPNQEEKNRIVTTTQEETTVQIPELKEKDIVKFIENTEQISKIDSNYTKKIGEAKSNKKLTDKLTKERELKIFTYLKKRDIEPKDYILKSTKIMMAFIGLQMSNELLNAQIAYVKKNEPDPAKQKETIKMIKQISVKIAQKYLENVNDSEKKLIKKHQKELEKVMANKKVKM